MKEYICKEDLHFPVELKDTQFSIARKFEEVIEVKEILTSMEFGHWLAVRDYNIAKQLPTVTKADICREFIDRCKTWMKHHVPAKDEDLAYVMFNDVLEEMEQGE